MTQLDYPDASEKSLTDFRKAFGQNQNSSFCQAEGCSGKGFGLCSCLKLPRQPDVIPPRTKQPKKTVWNRRLLGGLSNTLNISSHNKCCCKATTDKF